MVRRARGSRSAPPLYAGRQAYQLVLYVGGASPMSRAALTNVRNIVETHLKGRCRLTVVDLFQEPAQARDGPVDAVPMLVRRRPLPVRRMVAGLASEERVLSGLGLTQAPDQDRGGG